MRGKERGGGKYDRMIVKMLKVLKRRYKVAREQKGRGEIRRNS